MLNKDKKEALRDDVENIRDSSDYVGPDINNTFYNQIPNNLSKQLRD